MWRYLLNHSPGILVFAVLEEGLVTAGDSIELLARDETSELVRQHFLRFFSRVYSQFRGDVLGGRLGVV